jgi:NhaA family Na+:H+ antiporter
LQRDPDWPIGEGMSPARNPASRIARTLARLFRGEAGAGLLLIGAAMLAMLAANSGLSGTYHALLHAPLPWTPIAKLDTAHLWINDAVMAVFFFVVGLEIKRELLMGELSTPAQRRLPVLAAIGGMAAPALIYLGTTWGDPALIRGWAIPAATDIAFAVGVLALLGKRVPPTLRLFLLTVAIVDDLGAIAIIALFYTAQLKLAWLVAGLAVLAVMALLARQRVERSWIYALLALAAWYCVLHSGVHATVAGVLAAFTIPLRLDRAGDSLLLRMEHALVPWSAYFVVPLFGFANAGVELAGGQSFGPLPLGIALGLLIGKPIGILGAILLAHTLRLAAPLKASGPQVAGMAMLCGIGFTMSLFIGALAFPAQQALIDQAKIGVLAGSLASALCGFVLLRLAPQRS